jgi:hypothetical protein
VDHGETDLKKFKKQTGENPSFKKKKVTPPSQGKPQATALVSSEGGSLDDDT